VDKDNIEIYMANLFQKQFAIFFDYSMDLILSLHQFLLLLLIKKG